MSGGAEASTQLWTGDVPRKPIVGADAFLVRVRHPNLEVTPPQPRAGASDETYRMEARAARDLIRSTAQLDLVTLAPAPCRAGI